MNGQRYWLITVFGIMLLAFGLLWFAVPSQADARPVSLRSVGSRNGLGPLQGFGHSPQITFTNSFTVYLPLMLNSQCGPGQTITDPVDEAVPGYVDVTSLATVLNGQTLQATFKLRDVPAQLTFDRVGVPKNNGEYEWTIYIDADDNPQTGESSGWFEGADYELSAIHFVSTPDSPTVKPIADGVQKNVWQYIGSGSWRSISAATLSVDPLGDTMTLSGNIPGITSASRLVFYTYDYNPGGSLQYDLSSCATVSTSVPQTRSEVGVASNGSVQRWDEAR